MTMRYKYNASSMRFLWATEKNVCNFALRQGYHLPQAGKFPGGTGLPSLLGLHELPIKKGIGSQMMKVTEGFLTSCQVKCTGEKAGCQRCLSGRTRTKCTYPDAARANASKRRQVSVRKFRHSQDVDPTLGFSNPNYTQDSSTPEALPTVQTLDAGSGLTPLMVTNNSSETYTNGLDGLSDTLSDNTRDSSFPCCPSLRQAQEKSATFNSNFFPGGSIPSLDDDLDRFLGLGEIMFFCDVPVLQTPLNVPYRLCPGHPGI